MATKPKYGRIDSNQNDIVKELRSFGCSVEITSNAGKGFPDIETGWNGRNFLFEIKDPKKPPSQRKLTPDEVKWHEAWKGQVNVITTAEEAIKIMMCDNPPF